MARTASGLPSGAPAHRHAGSILAAGAGAGTLVLLLVAAASGPFLAPEPAEEIYTLRAVGWAGFALVGTVVAVRRPRTVIAWLLIGTAASVGAATLGASIAAWSYVWGGSSSVGSAGYVGVVLHHLDITALGLLGLALLRFPRDRWPSPGWGRLAWVLAVLATLTPIQALASPSVRVAATREPFVAINPWYTEGLDAVAWAVGPLDAIAVLLTIAIVINVVWRGWRSSGAERHQMKWLAYTAALVLISLPPLVALDLSGRLTPLAEDLLIGVAFFVLALGAMAAAMGVAILRYRLYDVDRVASRTATYALLALVLAGIYAGGVIAFGALVRPFLAGGGGDLIVAASTLLVAALFAPLRGRIKSVMDRRFNRSQVDAGRTAEEFARQLRDQLDLDELSRELHRVVARTVQPAAASVWLQ